MHMLGLLSLSVMFCVQSAAPSPTPSLLDQLAAAELRAAHALSEVASMRTQLQLQQQRSAADAAIDAEVQQLIDQM
eukprot:SAG11_NODE_11829_length_736_cov_1.304553_1_plen_75_part_10